MVNQQGTRCLKKVPSMKSSNLPLTYFCFLEKFTWTFQWDFCKSSMSRRSLLHSFKFLAEISMRAANIDPLTLPNIWRLH